MAGVVRKDTGVDDERDDRRGDLSVDVEINVSRGESIRSLQCSGKEGESAGNATESEVHEIENDFVVVVEIGPAKGPIKTINTMRFVELEWDVVVAVTIVAVLLWLVLRNRSVLTTVRATHMTVVLQLALKSVILVGIAQPVGLGASQV
ncbi:hypothetical protein F444_03112 [Phytophthora nicotianae P1976]|uniref:Uncharacterized protein n=1 Tax=Phytophthora nicotianae P1976 TaxID=1317066 RepID=A0A081AV82_PHYNI|nr:hypothetical protein F444_03112 [Phytophthora nicotianae P1976]